MAPEPLSEAIRALSQFLVADSSIGDTLHRVAEITENAVAPVAYVGISLLDAQGEPTTAVFTDDASPQIDKAQYDAGDGPCLTSWRERRVVGIADTSSPTEYAEFCRAAADHGIRSTLSMPLVASGQGIGAMNLYSEGTDAFSADDEELAGQLATTAAVVLSNALAYWGAHELSENLQTAMQSRAIIEQAKGVLIANSRGLDADAAFDLLVKASQRENVKLREIARRIVEERRNRDASG